MENKEPIAVVNVEKQHINMGIRDEPMNCPIAIALQQHLGVPFRVTDEIASKGWGADKEYVKLVSKRGYMHVIDFIEYFDDGEEVPEIIIEVHRIDER